MCQELLSESFFVFALSAYGRLICEYTDMMCTNPPVGASFGSVMVGSITGMLIMGIFSPPLAKLALTFSAPEFFP